MSADTRLARARAAVAAVVDPEIPALTIEELGMLRGVALEGETVVATITPSYIGCPATQPIARDVADALASAGFPGARVRTASILNSRLRDFLYAVSLSPLNAIPSLVADGDNVIVN